MIVAGSASPLLLSSAGGYNLTKSLRFRRTASAYLNRTPASAGNRQIWTWSGWVKLGSLSVSRQFFGTTGGSTQDAILFNADNQLVVFSDNASQTLLRTAQLFRDPAAWYHVVVAVDTTQATSSNRTKIYVNGVQVTAFEYTQYPSQNFQGSINNNVIHYISTYDGSAWAFDGYLAEVNFIGGTQLTPSSFGQTSTTTGVWIPKKYSGSYGTNGFYLPFTNTTSTSTLGNDFSGNSNTWTVNNISLTAGTTYDSMTDVPTNTNSNTANYCVLNTLDGTNMSYITVSNANLTYSEPASANGWRAIRGTIGVTSGKYRFSVYGTIGASTRMQLGLCTSATDLGGYYTSPNIGVQYNPYDANYSVNGTATAYGSTQRITAVFDFIFDASTGQCWVAVNGTLLGGNPNAGTGEMATFTTTSPVFPVTQAYGSSYDVNFGQRPWDYTIATASGFYPLNTYNLPTPTILAGNKYMDVTTYTGNGTAGRVITMSNMTNVGFAWVKIRSGADDHRLANTVTGGNRHLKSNATDAESTGTNVIQAFSSNTFTVGSDNSVNVSSSTYVGWVWANDGTSGSSNTQGTITSTVSANTTAGFSVVTYTGTGSGTPTVGHGLGVAPSMIFVKSRSNAVNWGVGHVSAGWTNGGLLNATNSFGGSTYFASTAPTSTVFSIQDTSVTNISGATYVAYCFAQIAGYSAFGSYTGNGSSDGPFIFTGFRPRFVMFKGSSIASNWCMLDSSRNTYNLTDATLQANDSAAELTNLSDVDFLSNGIKIRDVVTNDTNVSGQTYIYMAFAENPFKIANAR